jgi:hypothetical protein
MITVSGHVNKAYWEPGAIRARIMDEERFHPRCCAFRNSSQAEFLPTGYPMGKFVPVGRGKAVGLRIPG